MPTLKEAAEKYEASSLKNISELKEVSTDLDVKEEMRTNSDGEDYKVNYIEVEGVQYRVPIPVLGSLKSIMEKKPALKTFCVSRVGTTKEDTKYTVIPLD